MPAHRSAEPSPAEFNQLLALYNARRFPEMEQRALLVVSRFPNSGFAWKLLGAAQQMQGKNALAAFQKTAALMPNDAEAHFNLGVVQKALGQLAEAASSYRCAIKINPAMLAAHSNLGNALRESGHLEEAVTCYRRALKVKPDAAETHNNLGSTLRDLGQMDEALASYQRAIALKPDFADAHFNLGNAYKLLGKSDEAAASYRKAVGLKPDLVSALINLGSILKEKGQTEEALDCYQKASALKSDSAELYNNMGVVLKSLKRYDDAAASFRRALELNSNFPEAYGNTAALLSDIGEIDRAIENYRRALELRDNYDDALNSLLFVLNYAPGYPPASYLAEAKKYGAMVTKKVTARYSEWCCKPSPQRLRVGIVSGDLRIHSVGHFIDGLIPHIDAGRIELFAYSTYPKEDELTARIRPYFSAWKSLAGMGDADAARLIHDDGVHVLLDISGHTAHNRLPVFAWKPAPVQANWLGLPNTTGVQEIDYIIGDPVATPPEIEPLLTESVWRMPECYVCFAAPAHPLKVAPLPALTAGQVTFGSFNNLTKMNDEVVELWARILNAVPESRLHLKTGQLNDDGIRALTLQRFAAQGIAEDRLVLGRTQGTIEEHLAEYNRIDIALDTFPYTGTTTNIEALWMGVPVLSLEGGSFMTRSAKSVAHYAGLPDWVAHDKDDYVRKAAAFAADLTKLSELRTTLRQQVLASPVFDVARFARNFEDALWGMWAANHR